MHSIYVEMPGLLPDRHAQYIRYLPDTLVFRHSHALPEPLASLRPAPQGLGYAVFFSDVGKPDIGYRV